MEGLPAVGSSLGTVTHTPRELELFMFSAAIGAVHRIHYDRDFARDVDGHPDLVIQGPLQAVHAARLAQTLAQQVGGRLTTFSYRNEAPAYVGDELRCSGSVTDVAVTADHARLTCELAVERVAPDGPQRTLRATAAIEFSPLQLQEKED